MCALGAKLLCSLCSEVRLFIIGLRTKKLPLDWFLITSSVSHLSYLGVGSYQCRYVDVFGREKFWAAFLTSLISLRLVYLQFSLMGYLYVFAK